VNHGPAPSLGLGVSTLPRSTTLRREWPEAHEFRDLFALGLLGDGIGDFLRLAEKIFLLRLVKVLQRQREVSISKTSVAMIRNALFVALDQLNLLALLLFRWVNNSVQETKLCRLPFSRIRKMNGWSTMKLPDWLMGCAPPQVVAAAFGSCLHSPR